jgi:hypothetical protein
LPRNRVMVFAFVGDSTITRAFPINMCYLAFYDSLWSLQLTARNI